MQALWTRLRARPIVTGIVVALIGLVLAVGGGWLTVLGGGFYYLFAGLGLVAVGVMLLMGRRDALWVYGVILVATLLWSLAGVRLDGWRLMPRLLAPALLGLWLWTPWVCNRLDKGTPSAKPAPAWLMPAGCLAIIALVFVSGLATTAARHTVDPKHPAHGPGPYAAIAETGPVDEWRHYGRTAAGTRFSPLAQITPANVGKLELAWSYRTGDLPKPGENSGGKEFNVEATPIKVGNTLYFCTPHRWVIALDAVTGEPRWTFNPHADTSANTYLACRGVAYYEAKPGTPCAQRIITTTATAQLIALDAATGTLCPNFGQGGRVSLTDRLGEVPPGFHFISSQPLVVNDRVILGGWIYDNQAEGEPSGVVRAYDPVTGALAWAWDLGRADPTAPLKPGETYTRGTPNGWGTYTADPALGLVYVPLGNATPDYYGAKRRPFDETYSSSLVALDIATGQERWRFQTVHHDVWDYDLPVGPSLVDLNTPNGPVQALVQSTKTGDLFVLDRRTGRPVTGVEETKAPGDPLPGDHLSPTQPHSIGLPSLGPADLRDGDIWGVTPIDQMLCRLEFYRNRYDGAFTPPSTQGSIVYPAFDGVTDWYGISIDPSRRLLVANSSYIPFVVKAVPTAEAVKKGVIGAWAGWGHPMPKAKPNWNPQYGAPYAVEVRPWLNLLGAPCIAPPWGKLTAIDLVSRRIVWQRPIGTTRDTGLFGTHTNLPLPTGVFNIGGNVLTGGGLAFIGATADQYLRAFDVRNGRKLWQARLPAGGQANPMTYQGADGRQYLVIVAGGHGGLKTRSGDYVMAYALPKP